jgi:hypothetical protein
LEVIKAAIEQLLQKSLWTNPRAVGAGAKTKDKAAADVKHKATTRAALSRRRR